jgi:DinB superfamily
MEALQTALALRHLVEEAEPRLTEIGDEAAGHPAGPGKWSRKQMLGHLIDSAANNHQRFIRLQRVPELHFPGYQQNEWVALNQYAGSPWAELVALWAAYNRHLARVIEYIDPQTLGHVWDSGNNRYTLDFIVSDYLVHLRHHLEQILSR